MANKIFDRDTLLDLTVNVVPLFIIAFFVVAFAVLSPFGIDPLASAIQFGLLAIPFVLLAILTYFAGRAVAGSEQSGDVYLPGQASVRGAEPLESHGSDEAEVEAETAAGAVEGETEADDESAADADADDAPSADDETDADVDDADSEADGEADTADSTTER